MVIQSGSLWRIGDLAADAEGSLELMFPAVQMSWLLVWHRKSGDSDKRFVDINVSIFFAPCNLSEN